MAGIPAKIRALNREIAALQVKIHNEVAAGGASAGTVDKSFLDNDLKQRNLLVNGRDSLANNSQLAQAAQPASKVRPATTRNLVMGFGLGLVIGLVLVSLAEALDTRVRHSDEVVQWLGLRS